MLAVSQPFQKPRSLSGKWPSVEEGSCKDVASDDYQRNPSVIVARLPVSLSLIEVDNGGFHEVLRNDLLLPLGLKKARWAYVIELVLLPWRLRQVWNLIQVLFLLKFFGKSVKDLFYPCWRPTSNGFNVDGLGAYLGRWWNIPPNSPGWRSSHYVALFPLVVMFQRTEAHKCSAGHYRSV